MKQVEVLYSTINKNLELIKQLKKSLTNLRICKNKFESLILAQEKRWRRT